jgi:membrane-bound inhibitor of C-type lysozyme
VLVEDPNPVFSTAPSWIAYGGCPGGDRLDAVGVTGGGQRLAAFADPGGQPGGYPYSAATLAVGVGAAGTSRVVSMPVGFGDIRTDPAEGGKAGAILAARVRVLADVLLHFGFATNPIYPSQVPDSAAAFAVGLHPNPFNPVTTISYTAPRPGRLTVKVYDLRGRLVRTVFDDQVTVSGSVDWDGTDGQGARVASGVYFYEVRLGGETRIGKMALIK